MIQRLRLFFAFLATLLFLPASAGAQSSAADASPGLLDALNAVRGSMATAVAWANGPASSAAMPAAIGQLSAPDRDAIVYWLSSHGRGPLHARGASDAQIGVPYYAIDYNLVSAQWPASVQPLAAPAPAATSAPTPAPRRHNAFGILGAVLPELHIPVASSSSSSSQTTTTSTPNGSQTNTTTESSGTSVSIGVNPWAVVGSLIDASAERAQQKGPTVPWRDLSFAASTLGNAGSGIGVTRGFAAVRSDGTEGLACVSFVNNGAKAATEIDIDIEILDTLGLIRRVAPLRLNGSFAPGVEVGGPPNVQSVDRARGNCVIDGENKLTNLTDPFSSAGAVVYSVRRVQFADGTLWLQAGANPWS